MSSSLQFRPAAQCEVQLDPHSSVDVRTRALLQQPQDASPHKCDLAVSDRPSAAAHEQAPVIKSLQSWCTSLSSEPLTRAAFSN